MDKETKPENTSKKIRKDDNDMSMEDEETKEEGTTLTNAAEVQAYELHL